MDRIEIPNEILIPEIGRLLAEGRQVEFRPKGNSMLPFIRQDKDTVVLQKAETVEKGDIVLARLGKRFVLHRVIGTDGENLTLMGDGNVLGTEKCTKADILGTVILINGPKGRSRKPGKGRLWLFLKPVRRYILAIYRRLPKRSR